MFLLRNPPDARIGGSKKSFLFSANTTKIDPQTPHHHRPPAEPTEPPPNSTQLP